MHESGNLDPIGRTNSSSQTVQPNLRPFGYDDVRIVSGLNLLFPESQVSNAFQHLTVLKPLTDQYHHSLSVDTTVTVSNKFLIENDVLFSNDTGKLGKINSECSYTGVEPKTFRLLVRMFYH